MNACLRALGASAIIGGILRLADSFTADMLPQTTLALLYLATDMFLLAGIAGLWLKRRASLGIAGTVGLAVFVIGILIVRASAFGAGSYALGAAVAAIGLAVYSVEALFQGSRWAPIAWIAALVLGVAVSNVWAGLLFGLGFVAAGIETIYGAAQSAHTATSTVT